jgi:hypothetical protein
LVRDARGRVQRALLAGLVVPEQQAEHNVVLEFR